MIRREAVFIHKDEERAVLGCSVPIVSCELVLFDNGSSAVVDMSDRCTLTRQETETKEVPGVALTTLNAP